MCHLYIYLYFSCIYCFRCYHVYGE